MISLVFLQGCGISEREKNLKKAQQEMVRKEQQLLKWEQRLKIREMALEEANSDADTTLSHHPEISGRWAVKMTCIETNCEGSALGDTKTEQWVVSFKGNAVVVKAYSGVVLTRVYIGAYENEVLKVADDNPGTDAVISADLNFSTLKRVEGTREVKQKDCKITYSISAERAK